MTTCGRLQNTMSCILVRTRDHEAEFLSAEDAYFHSERNESFMDRVWSKEKMISMMTKSQYQQWNPSITDTIGNQHRLTSFPGLARSSLAARKIRAEFRAASDEHLTASLGVPGRRGLRRAFPCCALAGCPLFWDCLLGNKNKRKNSRVLFVISWVSAVEGCPLAGFFLH